jgi:hypothetical protein
LGAGSVLAWGHDCEHQIVDTQQAPKRTAPAQARQNKPTKSSLFSILDAVLGGNVRLRVAGAERFIPSQILWCSLFLVPGPGCHLRLYIEKIFGSAKMDAF